MSIIVSDIILRVGDHLGNLSVGQIDDSQKIRAIDSAVNYIRRKIGSPLDERKYTFYFAADTLYYDMPSDFKETIALNYADVNLNVPYMNWDYRPYQEILAHSGVVSGKNQYGHIVANSGSHQLIMSGSNKNLGSILESFDSTLWTASGDASGIALDTVTKMQGSASQKFTVTYSTGTATLTSPSVSFDLRELHEKIGVFRSYVYIPSTTGLTSMSIRYTSTAGNYYTITTTTKADGSAFDSASWNLVGWNTANAVATGSPDLSSISEIKVFLTIGATFVTTANFRIDDLYTIIPDEMELIYRSKLKGTTSGGTNITTITKSSDILNYDEDFIEPIALRAALYLWPQLQGDATFMQIYQNDFVDVIRTWARAYPLRRENNNLRTVLKR